MYTTDVAYDGPIFLVPLSPSYPSSPVLSKMPLPGLDRGNGEIHRASIAIPLTTRLSGLAFATSGDKREMYREI